MGFTFRHGFAYLALPCALLGACEKKASTEAAASASASAAASAPSAETSAEPEAPWFVGTWQASLDVERYAMEMKKSEGAVKDWEQDEGKEGTGKAILKFTLDENSQATGTVEGALGALGVSGVLEEETLRLKLMAQNPGEPGATYNGVIVATKTDDGFTGELKASSGDSLKVRRASVAITKGGSEKAE
jgi:hypothetical protein